MHHPNSVLFCFLFFRRYRKKWKTTHEITLQARIKSDIYQFYSHSTGQSSVIWLHLALREACMCIQLCPERITEKRYCRARQPQSYQIIPSNEHTLLLLLLLSHFSRVWLCATPETAAHQAPQSLGFSRQEHWSGLPFPSPKHESEKWKGSRSVVSDS